MTLNELLPEIITRLDSSLVPPHYRTIAGGYMSAQSRLKNIIDNLGVESTAAQGLRNIVTTCEKFLKDGQQYIYLVKDPTANNSQGLVVGLIKVGHKKLYIHDQMGNIGIVEPLCVLDFYVLNDYQRHGYGKHLFDHMLQDMKVEPSDIAIDGPSEKMTRFLAKHYGIHLIKQSNNFSLPAEMIERAVETMKISNAKRTGDNLLSPRSVPVSKNYSSPIGHIIHGDHSANGVSSTVSPVSCPDTASIEVLQPEVEEPRYTLQSPVVVQSEVPLNLPQQSTADRPSTLDVTPAVDAPKSIISPAGSTLVRRNSQLNEQGFFDIKYYHNKLW